MRKAIALNTEEIEQRPQALHNYLLSYRVTTRGAGPVLTASLGANLAPSSNTTARRSRSSATMAASGVPRRACYSQ